MDFFGKMMNLDPAKRLNMDEVLVHPWMLGEIPTNDEMFEELAGRKAMIEESK